MDWKQSIHGHESTVPIHRQQGSDDSRPVSELPGLDIFFLLLNQKRKNLICRWLVHD